MDSSTPLTVSDLTVLGMLATCVQAGQPITWLDEDNNTHWGISRAFTRDGGGFLNNGEDVRDGFVWISGGSHFGEQWIPVGKLAEGIRTGVTALDYRP